MYRTRNDQIWKILHLKGTFHTSMLRIHFYIKLQRHLTSSPCYHCFICSSSKELFQRQDTNKTCPAVLFMQRKAEQWKQVVCLITTTPCNSQADKDTEIPLFLRLQLVQKKGLQLQKPQSWSVHKSLACLQKNITDNLCRKSGARNWVQWNQQDLLQEKKN